MTQPTPPERDKLGIALERTEAKLAEKLEEACVPDTRNVSEESTVEIAKLSDSLLAAAHAAKDVVSLRQRRRETGRQDVKQEVAPEPEAIREFTDRDGKQWRVWAVVPTHTRGSKREATLGEFEEGWLAFETLDETERKRLPHYPANWRTLSAAKLQELLGLAIEAPTRRPEPRSPDSHTGPPN
jgi:hypothetical protein